MDAKGLHGKIAKKLVLHKSGKTNGGARRGSFSKEGKWECESDAVKTSLEPSTSPSNTAKKNLAGEGNPPANTVTTRFFTGACQNSIKEVPREQSMPVTRVVGTKATRENQGKLFRGMGSSAVESRKGKITPKRARSRASRDDRS